MAPERIYAIGDIHGHLGKLLEVHDWIERDQRQHGGAQVVHVGDLVDRGPDSKGVIDYLIDGIEAGEDWAFLKGNHDRMMSFYLEDVPRRDTRLRAEYEWLHPRLGGWETLESYGVDMALEGPDLHADARAKVPQEHKDFLAGLDLSSHIGDVFICHAGIRPGVGLAEQVEDDLIWIRDEFHFSRADHGALVVHGHTPVEEVSHYGNRVNVDTGAAYGGPLSAIVIEGGDVFELGKRGRKLVKPPQR